MELSGRVSLVTGAAGGIGRAFCRALLAAGAKVVATDIDEKNGEQFAAELVKEFGERNVIFVKVDVTISDSLEEAFKAAKSEFGRLDIVVNNAGVLQEVFWEKTVDVNVKGNINGVLLAHKYMGKTEGGSGGLVVNVASVAGIAPYPVLAIYCTTKHAVVALSRCYGAAVHVENTGVSVVAMCPGATDTTLMESISTTYRHPYVKGPIKEMVDSVTFSRPEFIAEGLIKIIREARSGSVWKLDEGVIEEVISPVDM